MLIEICVVCATAVVLGLIWNHTRVQALKTDRLSQTAIQKLQDQHEQLTAAFNKFQDVTFQTITSMRQKLEGYERKSPPKPIEVLKF